MSGRDKALTIWQAGVAAVKPFALMQRAFNDRSNGLGDALETAKRILVIGGGKAGAAMADALEKLCADQIPRITGLVNVPADTIRPLRAIELHAARPAGSNQPTVAGVDGCRRILQLVSSAGSDDVGVCLLSGGGSALMPAPVDGITLEDKQKVSELLHQCGATIAEMNAVRKHLSRVKGGRLAQAFTGRRLFSVIISDVIGDPLDVIASGPTAADTTTYADALDVLERFRLVDKVPESVRQHLQAGQSGDIPETPKAPRPNVRNLIIGNNAVALSASECEAQRLGFRIVNLGSDVAGDTTEVASMFARLVQEIRLANATGSKPTCILCGGETTVQLGPNHGLGGRNQEFVLSLLQQLGPDCLKGVTLLSGGTDGEDGPTDAAGAVADEKTLRKAFELHVYSDDFLARHDAYRFFDQVGGLLKTGPTNTNVMDVRVVLVE